MKNLAVLVLVFTAAACGGKDDADDSPSISQSKNYGPDAILIRLPKDSTGVTRAYKYPDLDATIWSAGDVPAISRILGFDAEAGIISFSNNQGIPARLSLRMGQSERATDDKEKLSSLISANGSDIYGVNTKGEIVRLSPAGTWTFKPDAFPRAIFPLNNGGLVIAAAMEGQTYLWRMQPPDERFIDTLSVDDKLRNVCTPIGGIVCFATENGLAWVRPRGLTLEGKVDLGDKVVSAIPTPSGDRLYAVTTGKRTIHVIDRYSGSVATTIDLPGLVRDLRMDQLGRYLLARPTKGDSAWVIAIGNNRLLGSAPTEWRGDLPTIAPDGNVTVTNGSDVMFLDPETLQAVRTVAGGGKDFWYFFFWNGFRPRAAGLDQPVNFGRDSNLLDSTNRALDSTVSDSFRTTPSVPAPTSPRAPRGTVDTIMSNGI